jgi:peptidyl-dipeptidase A
MPDLLPAAAPGADSGGPASKFLDAAEARLLEVATESNRAEWVFATYITPDTQELSARALGRLISETTSFAKRSTRWAPSSLTAIEARKIRLLRLSLPLVAPTEPGESEELVRRTNAMSSTFAKGRYAPRGSAGELDVQGLSKILEESHDPELLEEVWCGWHRIGRAIRPDFTRYVELANRGARELGFADLGAMWRSRYDMDPGVFEREAHRLWAQVEPLYRSLHAFVRARLADQYGPDRVPSDRPIPAYLLGNMWAQSWDGIFPLVANGQSGPQYDLSDLLRAKATSAEEMVRYGERFFVSLGFEPLPPTFWDRSMLVRPPGREVVCHASAWDIDFADDLRLKLCIEGSGEDFLTVHHELGHSYYQRAYQRQPYLFRESAHDGFHEAVGDTIALSITPEYLVRVGLLPEAPGAEGDLALLLRWALQKIAFLPFGLLIDEWRWRVFSGEVSPADYNRSWWELRERIQGVSSPKGRDETDFDPGSKYHVPANVPYIRYFLAHILQFQFHRALVRTAGLSGPLHRASIYGSRAAGDRLRAMLELGSSAEWPEALELMTGERRMDAAALLEYFAPLKRWLDEQNRGTQVGW